MITKFRCWWFGCEPHPQDPAPPEYLECQHCGGYVDYYSLVGICVYRTVTEWLAYWLLRKWFPVKCKDCGNRYGCDDGCLPF